MKPFPCPDPSFPLDRLPTTSYRTDVSVAPPCRRQPRIPTADHTVLVLKGGDAYFRNVRNLLTGHGFKVRLYSKADELFHSGPPEVPACLLLDPYPHHGVTGMQIQHELNSRGWDVRTVFLTDQWDVDTVVSAMKAGADDFLTRPCDSDSLLVAVERSLASAQQQWRDRSASQPAHHRAETLTDREREIVSLVISGYLNKEIADKLGLALVTVKVHRGRAAKKLGAGNAAELARLAQLCGIVG